MHFSQSVSFPAPVDFYYFLYGYQPLCWSAFVYIYLSTHLFVYTGFFSSCVVFFFFFFCFSVLSHHLFLLFMQLDSHFNIINLCTLSTTQYRINMSNNLLVRLLLLLIESFSFYFIFVFIFFLFNRLLY